MAARIGSAGGGAPSSAAEQASTLRAGALRLAQEELTSYAPVLEAATPHERELALAAACEPPAQIAETAAEVAELGVEVAESASEAVRGDALTGVLLAEAAASAAFRLVEINVGAGPVLERARRPSCAQWAPERRPRGGHRHRRTCRSRAEHPRQRIRSPISAVS